MVATVSPGKVKINFEKKLWFPVWQQQVLPMPVNTLALLNVCISVM